MITFTLFAPNSDAIIHELCSCIKASSDKRTKRFRRLKFMMRLVEHGLLEEVSADTAVEAYGLIADEYLYGETVMNIPDDDVEAFIRGGGDDGLSLVNVFRGESDDTNVKRFVEAKLTGKLNEGFNNPCYLYGCFVFSGIVRCLWADEFLKPYLAARRVVPMMKGGVAVQYYLIQKLKTRIFDAEIGQLFGGGDNDTGICIDPSLPNFDDVKDAVKRVVNEVMAHHVTRVPDNVIRHIAQVRQIDLHRPIGVSRGQARSFKVLNGMTICDSPVQRNVIHTSNSIYSIDPSGKVTDFDLERFKCVHTLETGKVLKSELLDVGITGKDDANNQHNFNYYVTQGLGTINITLERK